MAPVTWADIHAKATSTKPPPAPKTGFPSLKGAPVDPFAAKPPKFSDTLKSIAPPKPHDFKSAEVYAKAHGNSGHSTLHDVTHVVGKVVNAAGDMAGTVGARATAEGNATIEGKTFRDSTTKGLKDIRVKNGKVVLSGTPQEKAAALGLLLPRGGVLGSAQEVLGAGPGLMLLGDQLAHHPESTVKEVGKSIGSSMAGTFTGGRVGSKSNTPLDDVMNLWTVASLGAGGAARAGEMASADSLKGFAKAALTRAPQEPRVLHLGGDGITPTTAPVSTSADGRTVITPDEAPTDYLYHGTHENNLEPIRKHGIKPPDVSDNHVVVPGTKKPLSFFSQRAQYANDFAQRLYGDKTSVLRVPGKYKEGVDRGNAYTSAHIPPEDIEHLSKTTGNWEKLVPEQNFSRTLTRPASRNAAAALVQRHVFDRLLQKSINTGSTDLGSVMLRKLGSPETRVARVARQNLRVENDLSRAPEIELSHYGQGVTKRAARGKLGGLTAAQNHAAFIHSLGHTPESFATASQNAIDHAEALAKLEGVSPDVIKSNHTELLAKTKLASQHFDEHGNLSDPKTMKAVDAMRRAIHGREGMRGMTESEVNHALGSRWYAVHHLAEMNGKSFHQEIESLRKLSTPEAEARIAEIHGEFERKGAEVKDKAFYLPQSSEAKPLVKGSGQSGTRGRGAYGFAPPKDETTHAQMGHLFNRGDYRTNAVALAQHSFGKQAHLEAMNNLHDMLLSLSHKNPEDVGHESPLAVRVAGPPSDELKRYFNSVHPGDVTQAEEKNALARWNEAFPGFKPHNVPEGENVRWLHPDTASVFKPHQVGDTARQINKFNQLIRAQRFLNPKYGTWYAQNAVVGAVQQGALLPSNAMRYLKVVKKLDPETYSKIESAVGAGMSKSFDVKSGIGKLDKAQTHLASFWHHVNDHVFRMLSFVHEARRLGYHTKADFERLMDSDVPKVKSDRQAAIQESNNKAIDYWMTPKERATVRQVAAYWPWIRGSSKWTAQALRDHPVFGQGMVVSGREGKKYIDQFYAKHGGEVPPNEEGNYPSHLGPVDLSFLNPASTLAEDAESVAGISNPKAAKYLPNILSSASPAIKTGFELATGLKNGNLPKNGSVLGQTAHDLTSGILPFQLIKAGVGLGTKKTGTGPSSFTDKLKEWAGDPIESGVNYDQEAGLGAGINTSSLRGVAQATAQTKSRLMELNQLATKAKLSPKEKAVYTRYWNNENTRNVLIAQAAKKDGALSDSVKKTDQALSFDNPTDYLMATAQAAAKVTGQSVLLSKVKQVITVINSQTKLTQQEKDNAFYKVATSIWAKVNPSSVSSAYYARLAQANLGG